MLFNVVNKKWGTAYRIKDKKLKMAGKTGTCQTNYTSDDIQYISSFVGYFPADKPKYSSIVVIHKPNKNKGYYGSTVAAPVFKKIAEKLYSITPQLKAEFTWNEILKSKSKINELKIESSKNEIIDLKGKNFNEVLPMLENLGFYVEYKGKGLIIKKYNIIKNSNIKKIILELS